MRLYRLMIAGLAAMFLASVAAAQDRQEGYYYPDIGSSEVYEARVPAMPDSDRRRRLGFVSGVTKQLSELPYAAPYAIFAKGEHAEKLIIVGFGDGRAQHRLSRTCTVRVADQPAAPRPCLPGDADRRYGHVLRSRQAARLRAHHDQRRRRVLAPHRAEIDRAAIRCVNADSAADRLRPRTKGPRFPSTDGPAARSLRAGRASRR